MRSAFLIIFILVASIALISRASVPGALPTSAVANIIRYHNCSTGFNCANFKNISYPFWAKHRPSYCGHPSFELDCSNEAPTLMISSQSYRVLDINPVEHSISVTRPDFWDTVCPMTLLNTTINFDLFRYGSGVQNVTVFYGCHVEASTSPTAGVYGFNCSLGDVNITSYWRNNEVMSMAAHPRNCNFSIYVPVFQSLLARHSSSLQQLVRSGFSLTWDAHNEMCDECKGSGGFCGYLVNDFACLCHKGVFPISCSGQDSKKGLTIGLAVGCAFAVGGMLCAVYFMVRHRKQLIVERSTSKDMNGGSGPPLSSNNANAIRPLPSPSPTTPSANYYESPRSSYYADPESDLESGITLNGVRIFSYNELEEATENFDCSKELGDGGYGVVYHGKLRDGRSVAVKRLYERNSERFKQFMNEVEILTRLRHPNLVTLYGSTSRRSRDLLLVYEFISNGTLADHLHGLKASSGAMSWPVRLSIAIETADALAFLHASEIIHRDVKTNNILLDQNFHVKVADFGLSRLYPSDVTHVSTAPQGTPGYVDPEYYQCYHLTSKSDVYSFGVVLAELVSSKQAVDTNRHRHDVNLANMAVSRIQSQSLHELVDPWLGYEGDCEVRRAVTAVAELAFGCLQQEMDMRPTMEEVVEGLKMIEREYNDEMKQKVQVPNDDVVLLKRRGAESLSPNGSALLPHKVLCSKVLF